MSRPTQQQAGLLALRRVVGAVAVAVLAAGSVIPAAAAAAEGAVVAAPARQQVGFAAGAGLFLADPSELASDLDGMAALGAGWIRVDVTWAWIEPERGRFDWESLDRVIEGARARGLAVLGVIGYSPAWARPAGTSDKTPPTDPAEFARFAGVAARRYATAGVVAWEIWNEPNLATFWEPKPDPAEYSRLLAAASTAIRNNTASAIVLNGGLAPARDEADGSSLSPRSFLAALYQAGAAAYFDAIAAHPYSYPLLPTEAADWNAFMQLPQLYELAVSRGDAAKRLWLTEYGAPSGPQSLETTGRAVSEERQAALLVAGIDQANLWPWVGPMFLYNYRDSPGDDNDPEHYFGLVRADGTRKPAWDAVHTRLAASAP